jgi:hypothetical protein
MNQKIIVNEHETFIIVRRKSGRIYITKTFGRFAFRNKRALNKDDIIVLKNVMNIV